MIVNCGKSCNACELRDPKLRCSPENLNMSTAPAYLPGQLNEMFSTIQERVGHLYDVNVVSTSPWVVTFDNFLTDDEIDALITTNEGHFERSTDTGTFISIHHFKLNIILHVIGQKNEFGEVGRILSKSRTSSNAWCRHECESNLLVQNIERKIEEVTKIPFENSESFQVLEYEVGQYYRTHHDMGE